MDLLPNTVDADILDKGHRDKARGAAAVAVTAQPSEVGWVSEVSKDTASNREGHWNAWDQIVENTTLDVSSVVRPHVNPERLLIASEVAVHEDVCSEVRLGSNIIGLRSVAIESKHFGHFCIDSVRCVVANGQVFWIEELPDAEVS